jgi:DTW domain-containing protein YfiP
MRSVVLKTTPRCLRCMMTPRWCICAAHCAIDTPLAVDQLIHKRELFRPSSTGQLIQRLFTGSRQHVWYPDRLPDPTPVLRSDRELWILHPNGLPPPSAATAENIQLLLLDGAWAETAAMAKTVAGWGRLVSLPLQGTSRFWLRGKQDANRYSTAEALLYLLDMLGLQQAAEALRMQFELHVYASLRMRGYKQMGMDFLVDSPLPAALPDFLERFHTRRPL